VYSTNPGTIIGSGTLTQYISSSFDDANFGLPALSFPFFVFGSNYQSTFFVGSNSYITFGFGSSNYYGLSASNPGRGLLIQSADNSYQRVWAGPTDAFSFRVYWEGTAATSGSVGSPNIVWETTFYTNNNIMVVISLMSPRAGAISGLSDGSSFVISPPFPASSSTVIETSDGGSAWSYRSGSYV